MTGQQRKFVPANSKQHSKPTGKGDQMAESLEKQQFDEWSKVRDGFELSWCSNPSLSINPLPADYDQLKEFAWQIWQLSRSWYVLTNFTVGEVVDVAVRAEREACANEARRGDNGHDPSDRIAQAILARSTK
jgi:hypothetical protein